MSRALVLWDKRVPLEAPRDINPWGIDDAPLKSGFEKDRLEDFIHNSKSGLTRKI